MFSEELKALAEAINALGREVGRLAYKVDEFDKKLDQHIIIIVKKKKKK